MNSVLSKIEMIILKIRATLKKSATSRYQWIFLSILLSLGFVGLFFTQPLLATSPLSLGKHTFALFIPLIAGTVYYGFCTLIEQPTRRNKLIAVALFILLTVPMVGQLGMEITHLKDDDASKTTLAANYMVKNNTLYGVLLNEEQRKIPFEELRTTTDLPVFELQYGLRYILAGFIAVFGGQYRGLHALWLFSYLLVFIFAVDVIAARNRYAFSFWAAILGVLSAPYAAKIILMTMNESLAVMAMALFALFYGLRRNYLAAVSLAFIPFFRQNMTIFTILTFLFVFKPKDIRVWFLFFLVFFFPVWHNLYYTGEFSFFTNGSLNGVASTKFLSVQNLRGADAFFHNLFHYIGICSELSNLGSYVIAWLFLPLSTAILLVTLFTASKGLKLKYFLLAGSAVGPAILFASDTYPRFEYVNVLSIFLAYCCFNYDFSRGTLSRDVN